MGGEKGAAQPIEQVVFVTDSDISDDDETVLISHGKAVDSDEGDWVALSDVDTSDEFSYSFSSEGSDIEERMHSDTETDESMAALEEEATLVDGLPDVSTEVLSTVAGATMPTVQEQKKEHTEPPSGRDEEPSSLTNDDAVSGATAQPRVTTEPIDQVKVADQVKPPTEQIESPTEQAKPGTHDWQVAGRGKHKKKCKTQASKADATVASVKITERRKKKRNKPLIVDGATSNTTDWSWDHSGDLLSQCHLEDGDQEVASGSPLSGPARDLCVSAKPATTPKQVIRNLRRRRRSKHRATIEAPTELASQAEASPTEQTPTVPAGPVSPRANRSFWVRAAVALLIIGAIGKIRMQYNKRVDCHSLTHVERLQTVECRMDKINEMVANYDKYPMNDEVPTSNPVPKRGNHHVPQSGNHHVHHVPQSGNYISSLKDDKWSTTVDPSGTVTHQAATTSETSEPNEQMVVTTPSKDDAADDELVSVSSQKDHVQLGSALNNEEIPSSSFKKLRTSFEDQARILAERLAERHKRGRGRDRRGRDRRGRGRKRGDGKEKRGRRGRSRRRNRVVKKFFKEIYEETTNWTKNAGHALSKHSKHFLKDSMKHFRPVKKVIDKSVRSVGVQFEKTIRSAKNTAIIQYDTVKNAVQQHVTTLCDSRGKPWGLCKLMNRQREDEYRARRQKDKRHRSQTEDFHHHRHHHFNKHRRFHDHDRDFHHSRHAHYHGNHGDDDY